MRRLAYILLLCIASVAVMAQDYHVVNVRGKVSISGKAGTLKPNDKLRSEDKLVFASKSDAVAVVSAKAGRFIISPSAQKKDGELMAYVKDAITPGTKKLSTRSGLFNNALDFARYFQDTVLILPVMKYVTSLKQDDQNFFFIRYTYNGEEISKKLSISGDTLVINRSELYSVDKKPVEPSNVSDMKLLRFENSQIRVFTKMAAVSPESSELSEGVNVLRQLYPRNEVREETLNYLSELYGKIDEANFNNWYRSLN